MIFFLFQVTSGQVLVPSVPGLEYTLSDSRLHYTLPDNKDHFDIPENRLHYTMREED